MNFHADDNIRVVAVCGNQARVYGTKNDDGVRPFLFSRDFNSRGAALVFADDYEASERGTKAKRVTRAATGAA